MWNGAVYHYKQLADLSHWIEFSTVYLGQINFTSNYLETWLCVFLQANNQVKSNIIAVVNPQGQNLKIEPHEIIEVIVYTSDPDPEWQYVICSDFLLEEIGKEVLSLETVLKPNDLYGTCPRYDLSKTDIKEHHYWFRYNKYSISRIAELTQGTYPSGFVVFYNKGVEHSRINLLLSVKEKNKSKLHHRPCLLLPLNHDLCSLHKHRMRRTSLISDVYLQEIQDCTIESGCLSQTI